MSEEFNRTDSFIWYLGGAETVLGITDQFRLMPGQRGLYEIIAPS